MFCNGLAYFVAGKETDSTGTDNAINQNKPYQGRNDKQNSTRVGMPLF